VRNSFHALPIFTTSPFFLRDGSVFEVYHNVESLIELNESSRIKEGFKCQPDQSFRRYCTCTTVRAGQRKIYFVPAGFFAFLMRLLVASITLLLIAYPMRHFMEPQENMNRLSCDTRYDGHMKIIDRGMADIHDLLAVIDAVETETTLQLMSLGNAARW
jgi:hypothetical protein